MKTRRRAPGGLLLSVAIAFMLAMFLGVPPLAPAQALTPGYALSFNGANNYVLASIPTALASNYTISAWVYIRHGSSGLDNGSAVLSSANCGATVEFLLLGPPSSPQMLELSRCNSFLGLGSTTSMPLQQWTHVAVTVSAADQVSYFINGQPAGTWQAVDSDLTIPTTFNLGDNTTRRFDGLLDEVQIWNTQRTQGQIQAGLHKGLAGDEPGLVGYWRFDEGSGAATANSAPGGGNATPVNNPEWVASTVPFVPVAVTTDATSVFGTQLMLNGTVEPNGLPATAWFEWGFTTNYGNIAGVTNLGASADTVNLTVSLTGLMPLKGYHFRVCITNAVGASSGADFAASTSTIFANINAGLPGVQEGSVAWGDYDNDGRLDILLTGDTGSQPIAQVWRNTGSGFVNINAGLPGVYFSSVAWGDYDNDGRLDILLTGLNMDGNPLAQVWRNTGNGFSNINACLPGVGYGSVSWGDYDNDGWLDILLTGLDVDGNPLAQVWRNTGLGFGNINAGLPGVEEGSAAWGDYDNDGRLDILLTGRDVNGNLLSQVWRNTGSGFVNINAGLPGVIQGSAAWGDYDGDGRLDIVLTGLNGSSLWRNTGSGFVNVNAGLPGVGFSSIAWGDFDNDGRLDILLTGYTGSQYLAQLWRNTGTGFTNLDVGLSGVYLSSVAWADYDGDRRLDVLLTGRDVNGNLLSQVWRNPDPAPNTAPTAPSGLAVAMAGPFLTLSWNAASDAQTPPSGLTYNLRIGSTPGASDLLAPMAAGSGLRRLPRLGNAGYRLGATLSLPMSRTNFYWSVQAVDSCFAGSPFAAEQSFSVASALTAINGSPVGGTHFVPADVNGDGFVDQSELNTVLSNYWTHSPWLVMTNTAGLGTTNVRFALTNASAWLFTVEATTNLSTWTPVGPAYPVYQFADPSATNGPQRSYRLRWP